jgi:hypothetical protein
MSKENNIRMYEEKFLAAEFLSTTLPLCIKKKIKGKSRVYVKDIDDLESIILFLEILDNKYKGKLSDKVYSCLLSKLLYVSAQRIACWKKLWKDAQVLSLISSDVGVLLLSQHTPLKDLVDLMKNVRMSLQNSI